MGGNENMDRKKIHDAITQALTEKGSRKFTQSLEFIINFRGVDFTKAENRLNIDILIPKGKGKEQNVVAFADGQMALEAKNAGVLEVIDAAGIAKLAADKPRLASYAKT